MNGLFRMFHPFAGALIVALALFTWVALPTTHARPAKRNYQLNLSHIECVPDNGVEVHFVLLNVPKGITPGVLTYTYGTIAPSKHTGNVWHYFDYQPDGYYDVQSATVDVNGVTVTLHNSGEYAGQYDCDPASTPEPTSTPVPPTATPEPTSTPVPPTATPEPTSTPVPTSTPAPATGSIGDFVWADGDADGVYANEWWDYPLEGFTVNLYEDDGDGVFEPGGDDMLLDTAVTDVNGLYLFTDVAAGTYWANVEFEDYLWLPTYPDQGIHGPITLDPGEDFLDADFGLYYNGSS